MTPIELEPPRSPSCLSDYALERLRHRELRGAQGEGHERHLGSCPSCRTRLQQLADERPPPLDWPAAARYAAPARADAGFSLGLWKGFWRWPTLAGAAVALVLAFGLRGWGVRFKGASWELGVIARRADSRTERLISGDRARPGERLRFEVSAPADGFVSVISLDAAGVVTPFVPASGAALPVAGGRRQLLAGAVALDQTLGDERLLLVACAQPLGVDRVVSAARQGLAEAKGRIDRVQDLGLGCQQRSFWIQKVAP
jgi:hypothetical protein